MLGVLGLETPAGSKESTEGFFETEGGISRFLRSFPASFPTVEATSDALMPLSFDCIGCCRACSKAKDRADQVKRGKL